MLIDNKLIRSYQNKENDKERGRVDACLARRRGTKLESGEVGGVDPIQWCHGNRIVGIIIGLEKRNKRVRVKGLLYSLNLKIYII